MAAARQKLEEFKILKKEEKIMDEFNKVNSNKNFLIVTIVIAIIAVGAGGFILGKYYSDISKEATEIYESGEDESEIAEKETGKCVSIQNINEKNQCWIDLAKEEKDESHCKKISADFPEIRGDCYTKLAILKDDSLICEKVITASLHKSCLEYFEGNDEKDETADWESYKNEEYGFSFKYPQFLKFYKPQQSTIGDEIFLGVIASENQQSLNIGQIGMTIKKDVLDPNNI